MKMQQLHSKTSTSGSLSASLVRMTHVCAQRCERLPQPINNDPMNLPIGDL